MAKVVIEKPARAIAEYEVKNYVLLPNYIPRGYSPQRIDLSTHLLRHKPGEEGFRLNIPIMSAAMQSVTGPDMAIAMARMGGLGVIFCSQSVDEQASMVSEVKKYKAGFVEPETVAPETSIRGVMKIIDGCKKI